MTVYEVHAEVVVSVVGRVTCEVSATVGIAVVWILAGSAWIATVVLGKSKISYDVVTSRCETRNK